MKKEESKPIRLLSLDTLRGFDMFWIIGAGGLVKALAKQFDVFVPLSHQLRHASWAGFHFYDLIFPLFMFISGVAIPFSLNKKLASGTSKAEIFKKVIKRVLILIAFGIIYNKGLYFENVRFASVLGQIGIAYLIAAVIALYTNGIKQKATWLFGILIGYSAIQLLIPVPGHGMGILTPEGSINAWVDQMFLPGLNNNTNDPEGILCTISASVMTLLGLVTGELLQSKEYSGNKKALIICLAGLIRLLAGALISPYYPVVKRIWTSTFNLVAGGSSLLLMGVFYWVIDVQKKQKWTFFFRVIGLNSITIYLLKRMVSFKSTSKFLFSGVGNLSGDMHDIIILTGVLVIEWVLLWFLYKNRIFLKI